MASDNSPSQDGGRRLGNRWNSEEAIMDPIRLLQELEREANEKRRGLRAAANAVDASAAQNKISNGPLLLLDDMAASNDKTSLLKETSTLNGPIGRRKTKNKSLPPRKKHPSVKEKTGVGGGGRGGSTLPVNKHAKTSNKSGKSASIKPVENNIPKVSFEEKKALTPVPEEQQKQETLAQLELNIREQPDQLVQEGDSKTPAMTLAVPEAPEVVSVEPKPKEKTSVLSRMRDAAKKINVAPSKLQQTVMNAKLLHNRLSHSKPNAQQDSSDTSQADSGSGQPAQDSSTAAPSMDLIFADSPDSLGEEEAPVEGGEKKEGAEDAPAAKPPEQERPKGATWTGTTANAELALKILNMSRRGDWLGVDALLKHVEKGDLPADLADEATGFTPLMYAVKDSRVGLADKFIDLGANVNAKAKDGQTALHLAAVHVREDMVRLLLNRRADPTVTGGPKGQLPIHVLSARPTGAAIVPLQLLLRAGDKNVRMVPDMDGNIPLFLAVEAGNHGVCRDLLGAMTREQVCYVHPATGNTALHLAARRRDLDIMRFLVECQSPVNHQNAEGQTPLHVAAREGDEQAVKLFHHAGANPNLIDREDRTPLHIATQLGHVGVVELLIDKYKASVHHRTKDGSTLMHIAAEAGRPETAMVFMKKGVPLHMSNKAGAKCIHTAAQKGYVDIVRTLLQKGEHVDVKTNDGHTALHVAVSAGQALVVEALLGHGAQVQFKAGPNNETPLHIAARVKNADDCAELLIKSGADVNEKDANGEIPLHFAAREGHLRTTKLLLEDNTISDLLNKDGESPLHVAVKNCHFPVVQALLEDWEKKNSDPEEKKKLANQKNMEGENSLHYAATITEKQKHYATEDRDIMRILLKHGGDVNAETRTTMETPIHHCSRTGNVAILQEIIDTMPPAAVMISCNQQARNGWAPLLYACDAGHPRAASLLIQNGARVDTFDETGKAALHLAAEKGHEELADILLSAKAFVNVRSQRGLTPLHLAAEKGYATLVRKLVTEHGAILDALSLNKKTPLHLAAAEGRLDVCKILLELKADTNALDDQGQTPMMLAIENDHSEVVKLFLRVKPDLAMMSNAKGFTCAHIAAMKGSTAVIKELMKFNKSIVTSSRNRTTDSTPLHLASAGGHANVVKMLLQAGADAKEENADGDTALHLAAKNGHVAVARVLSAIVPWSTTSKKTGLTALHVAAKNGQMDFVREMLTEVQAALASEPLPDGGDYGMTALHMAAAAGHEGVVRMLLNSSGIQADAPTFQEGMYPLHFAAQGGHLAVASILLSRAESQLQCVDKLGRTPLHVAAAAGKREMVGLLHSQGAEINAADNMGWTALHFAARHGYLGVVKILVENGAFAKAVTKDGKVPLCLAAAEGHYDIISYLLKKDHDTTDLMDDKHFLIDLMASGKVHQNRPMVDFILASKAPIDTAVKMARSYELLSLKEKERAMELEEMAGFCDNLANELLSIAASNNNTAALLRALDARNTPFLDVLIELQRKTVVAHPAAQKYLTELWMGSYHWTTFKIVMLFFGFLLCPVLWVASSLVCGNHFSNIPIVKFMSYLVSHIFFVIVLSVTIINPWQPLYTSTHLVPHWNEWLLIFWLLGMFITEITNPSDREGLGYIKTVVLFISAIAITVHLVALFFREEYYRLICLYIRNQLFAVALLLGFLEFLNFLTFHHLFGPWAVIIRDLIKDLMRFLAILLIFLVGFSLNMCAVYQPVFVPPRGDNITLPIFGQEFQSPINTFEMLFFSLFGLVEPDYMPPLHLSPPFAKIIVKVVFGVYMMVTVVVLINLLIAMMSDTYQRIQAQSDTEWKFGRAKLIRNMKRASPAPAPLNCLTFVPELIMNKCSLKKVKGGSTLSMLKDMGSGQTQSRTNSAAGARGNRRIMPLEEMMQGMNKLTNVVDWPSISNKYLENFEVRRASLSVVETLQKAAGNKKE
ncbi:no mechanoreceptor potential C [Dermacentor variabilis]|uniref:no mechanoreceptor potential C n=1 Tax=Dermacentor variabilis TaxID=34621 RepID=UPI003F5B0212